MSLNIEEGDEARLQLRYEVERIVDSRNGKYLVKWKHLPLDDATWEQPTSELLQSPAAKAAISRFRKQPDASKRADAPNSHRKRVVPGGPSSSADAALDKGSAPRWSHKVVRPLRTEAGLAGVPGSLSVSPRIFNGGLGEPPRQRAFEDAVAPGGLDREHRYWLVVRYASISNKCTLVPLLASGRFGGCGRRAGRIRWRPAPLKQGFERDAQASMLELVSAEGVQGAREAEGEVWCVDDHDVEQAAREQAAAARNKRRAMLDDGLDEATLAALGPDMAAPFGLTRSGAVMRTGGGELAVGAGFGLGLPPLPPAPRPVPRKREGGGGGSKRDGSAPPRKKKRLAPASSSCLACTKGKHCAHTCGVRGKAAEAAAAAAKAEADGLVAQAGGAF